MYDFQNFNFPLDYCLLNKKKHFHKKNQPSNFIFLASRELFLFFWFVFALSLAEITPYLVINMTKPSQFLKQKKIYSQFFVFDSIHNIYSYIKKLFFVKSFFKSL